MRVRRMSVWIRTTTLGFHPGSELQPYWPASAQELVRLQLTPSLPLTSTPSFYA